MGGEKIRISWGKRKSDNVQRRPIVFVSSTVYDKKDMFDHIRS